MYRVAVVASHPIQYQAPWFRALAGMVDLEVFFCHRQDAAGQAAAGFGVPFEWDVPLREGYRSAFLTNVARTKDVSQFAGCDTPEIHARLAEGQFDACVVSGWYLKSYVQAIRACWRLGIRVIVRGDSHLKTPRSRVTSAAKYLPYRWFLNRIDAHLYVGAANRAYLRAYGVPAERLFFAPHFVDNEFFATRAEQAHEAGTIERLRRSWGADPGTAVFLFVGKLIDKKRPADFVQALAETRRSAGSEGVRGVVVGAGPLQQAVASLAEQHGVPLHFAGFQNQSALPAFYAAADALVLPSDGGETWGLVVNEAMACGLPAIVSDAVGCADDLIRSGETGFAVPCGDVAMLGSAMVRLASMTPDERAVLSRAARDAVRSYTADAAALGLVQALDASARREVSA
jgi:glycosyltransferase involved in cell wall biosynthesis